MPQSTEGLRAGVLVSQVLWEYAGDCLWTGQLTKLGSNLVFLVPGSKLPYNPRQVQSHLKETNTDWCDDFYLH